MYKKILNRISDFPHQNVILDKLFTYDVCLEGILELLIPRISRISLYLT